MGCAASTSANVIVPMDQNPGAVQVGLKICAKDPARGAAAKQQDDVVPITDDDRSNTTTPLSENAQGLGAVDPPKGTNDDALRGESPPSPAMTASDNSVLPTPTMLDTLLEQEALRAPTNLDLLVPYWEKQPLPARPGTSTRKQQLEQGKEKKLVVYKTQKTKKLEADAKKKREEGGSPEKADKPKKADRPKSSLPPIQQRRKIHGGGLSDACEVMTPAKKAGGAAWEVCAPGAASPSDRAQTEEPTTHEVMVLSP